MKLRKLLTATAGFAVGTSLLATVLTSCSAEDIDEDLKIELDENGNLSSKISNSFTATYKDAIESALTRSSSWATFKEALAEEIVYKWFVDRAADKDSSNAEDGKNEDFRVKLNEIESSVKKSYDDNLQSCKDKYGSNYRFYFQNEYLSPKGGTEESYKHALTVEQVKDTFIEKLWDISLFGYCDGFKEKTDPEIYPRTFAPVKNEISEARLNDPASWSDIGFYAGVSDSFSLHDNPPKSRTEIDTNALARNPEGDYAVIQNYTFDRWFETEKPFFSAAALFKYTKPFNPGTTLGDIYNTGTGITLPDEPNEAFPFFGGYDPLSGSAGTKLYYNWYHDLVKGNYLTSFDDSKSTHHFSNGTTLIKNSHKEHTDDSQTLLLCYATKMLGNSDGALYLPYATAAASLYLEAVLPEGQLPSNSRMNFISSTRIAKNLSKPLVDYSDENNSPILRNFFFTQDDVTVGTGGVISPKEGSGIKSVSSYVDLSKIYEVVKDKSDDMFHSKIFSRPKTDSDFAFFYGGENLGGGAISNGVQFLTNTVRVDDLTAHSGGKSETQPWILELNQSGMHAQTIDGFNFIKNPSAYGQEGLSTLNAAKNVLKYRLMQKKRAFDPESVISANVFGKDGELATYFKNNFANIVLELAMKDPSEDENVFKPIADYNSQTRSAIPKADLFLSVICVNEQFTNQAQLYDYLEATIAYDKQKKYVDAASAANKQVLSYHNDQVKNSQTTYRYKRIYGNGLTAPLAYSYDETTTRLKPEYAPDRYMDFKCVNAVTYFEWSGGIASIPNSIVSTNQQLGILMKPFKKESAGLSRLFIVWAMNAKVDKTVNPFCPQIEKAKEKNSNRFWYNSWIVDSLLYQSMGNEDGLKSIIKGNAYDTYVASNDTDASFDNKLKADALAQAIESTYEASKILTSDNNLSLFELADNYFNTIHNAYTSNKTLDENVSGPYGSLGLSYKLFRATLTYLMLDTGTTSDSQPFGNFYKILNSQIDENEQAIIGYVTKYNTLQEQEKATSDYDEPIVAITSSATQYDWSKDVDNIYDQVGYSFGDITGKSAENAKIACDQYWNVIMKKFEGTTISKQLAGFTGLQTKSSSSLPSVLQTAAFDSFAKYTDGSRNLADSTTSSPVRYNQNDGVWFQFTGSLDANGKPITFDHWEYTDKDGNLHVFDAKQFTKGQLEDGTTYDASAELRLARKIAHYSTIDDLRTLANEIGKAHYGETVYSRIGTGEVSPTTIDEMRFLMLDSLPRFQLDQEEKPIKFLGNEDFINCFKRLKNVEVHEGGHDDGGSGHPYAIPDIESNSAYRLMLTQINKADITEKRLHPAWDSSVGTSGQWVDRKDAQGVIQNVITPEEFFYMLCQTACQTSVQSLAITQVVKSVFKDDETGKMKIFDASLYNVFDSVWIKDWSKKPIGA